MPFALVIVGLILVVTGARNSYAALGQQLMSDFTGAGNFIYWIVAIGIVGAIGYYSPLKNFSRLFMVLIIIALFLSNQGVFAKFTQSINAGPQQPPAQPIDMPNASPSTSSSPVNTAISVLPEALMMFG